MTEGDCFYALRTPTDVLTAFSGRRIVFLGDDTVRALACPQRACQSPLPTRARAPSPLGAPQLRSVVLETVRLLMGGCEAWDSDLLGAPSRLRQVSGCGGCKGCEGACEVVPPLGCGAA